MVDKKTEACYMCHAADQPLETGAGLAAGAHLRDDGTGSKTFGIIDPIYNERGCWQSSCHAHPETQNVLGVLDITMSMADVERAERDGRARLLTFALIAIAATSLMIYWLVGRIVLQPVRRLAAVTRKVADGDLSQKVDVGTRDEIGKLGESFNDMMQNLADAQRQLLQANKLASVGRLAAGRGSRDQQPSDRRPDLLELPAQARGEGLGAEGGSRGHRARDQALPGDRQGPARFLPPVGLRKAPDARSTTSSTTRAAS